MHTSPNAKASSTSALAKYRAAIGLAGLSLVLTFQLAIAYGHSMIY